MAHLGRKSACLGQYTKRGKGGIVISNSVIKGGLHSEHIKPDKNSLFSSLRGTQNGKNSASILPDGSAAKYGQCPYLAADIGS